MKNSEVDERLNEIKDAVDNLLDIATVFYKQLKGETLIQKMDYLRQTPFYPAIELCLSLALDLWIQKVENKDPDQDKEEAQEELFAIICTAFFINRYDILNKYVSLVDWTVWHPLDSTEIYGELYKRLVDRFPTLARFPKPSN